MLAPSLCPCTPMVVLDFGSIADPGERYIAGSHLVAKLSLGVVGRGLQALPASPHQAIPCSMRLGPISRGPTGMGRDMRVIPPSSVMFD